MMPEGVASGVGRDAAGDGELGNHLVLLVRLDGVPWLADVGFGDGLIEPALLVEGPFRQNGYLDFSLERLSTGWWRLNNYPEGSAGSFDFEAKPADPARLQKRCTALQSEPTSPFVLNAVVQRHAPGRIETMRGRARKTVSAEGVTRGEIGSADEYVETLSRVFSIDLPEAASLWPKIEARHAVLFGEQ